MNLNLFIIAKETQVIRHKAKTELDSQKDNNI